MHKPGINGHTISGLTVTGSHNVALFGVINGATIEKLTVKGSGQWL